MSFDPFSSNVLMRIGEKFLGYGVVLMGLTGAERVRLGIVFGALILGGVVLRRKQQSQLFSSAALISKKTRAPNLSAPSPTAGCAKILILLRLQFIIEYIKENISC